jgi:hypothetical protein
LLLRYHNAETEGADGDGEAQKANGASKQP